ncbi:uncharacterized protein LOC134229355 [Saccostrea cucullata]|uniref:uncharacterized protein LOC134229355 n=1 Tax=Saccostrea cuccullata TaxID=36930 RepID=UPI002ED092AD
MTLVEVQIQGSRKRTEEAKIDKNPVSKRENVIEECLNELLEMAKTITAEHGLRNYVTVFPILTLRQLAEKTPLTVDEMTASIDGLPKAKVNKYGAERFLEITKNYNLILSNLQQEEEEVESDNPEWESPYFVDESAGSSNTGRKRGAYKKRGFGRKKRGARSQSGSGNSGGFSDKGSKFSACRFSKGSSKNLKKVPSAGKNQRGGSSSSRGGANNSRDGLGFMPVPQPKQSFLGVDQAATFDSKRVHIHNLFRMVQYCENVADCRQSQLLLNYLSLENETLIERSVEISVELCVTTVCLHNK